MRSAYIPPFLLLFLAGCASAGEQKPMDFSSLGVPASFEGASIAAQPTNLTSWWQQLGDEQLSTLMSTAQAQNLDLKTAQLRLVEAQASARATNANLFPQVGANASARSGGSGSNTQDSYSGSVSASWDADVFGSNRSARSASQADVAATAASLASAQAQLAASVAQGYIDWRLATLRLEIAQNNLASQRETLQFIRYQAAAGITSQLDLEQSEASTAQTEAQLPSLQAAQAQALGQVALLLGQTITQTRPQLVMSGKGPQIPSSLLVGIPADVLRQRPDVEQAAQQLLGARARVSQAQADQYPSLSLSGSIGLDALDLPSVLSGATIARSLAGALAATLFDGGRLAAQVDVRNAQQEQAWLNYKSVVLAALEEVETGLVTYARQRERTVKLQQAARATEQAHTLAQAQFKVGAIDYLRLLDAQRSRLSAQDSLAQARSQELTALITVYKALGGGWSKPATQGEKHE